MDRLKPLDLERIEFERQFRGYRRREVDDIIARAAREIELLLSELREAKEAANAATQEVSGFRAQENTLKEALILAQKAADETRAAAHKDAEQTVAEAKRQASEVQQQMQGRLSDLRWEIERLTLEKTKFETRLRAMLEEQLSTLNGPSNQPALVSLEVHDAAG